MIPALVLAFLVINSDVDAVSTTNGQSTLVAWTNEFSVYQMAHSVYFRMMDSPFDRNAMRLDNGFDPHVATDGHGYLIGYSSRGSRFPQPYPYDSAIVQLVSAEGTPGASLVLSGSSFGGVTDVEWNGTHWMVAIYFAEGAEILSRVVLLDQALKVVATANTGPGYAFLERIGGRWWAIRSYSVEIATEAIEIRGDGTTGARFLTDPMDPIRSFPTMTHGAQPLLLVQNQHAFGDDRQDIDAIPFDPDHGFGARRPFLSSAVLKDEQPFAGGSLLLTLTPDQTRSDIVFVDASGEIRSSSLLYAGRVHYRTSLGTSKNGPLFLASPLLEAWSIYGVELYRYPITAIAPLDPMAGELVSQATLPQNRRRAARH